MLFAHSVPFDPGVPAETLRSLPEAPGVFALFAGAPKNPERPPAEPYISKTANLHRRVIRLLGGRPSASNAPSRRLELARMVERIEYTTTGSEFESLLTLYNASLAVFGDRARRRMHLRPPAFLRMSVENAYPRVYVTTRIAKSAAAALFGPFPSRAAAERYAEAVLNQFLLRRCVDDLHPDPAFPGCPYSEMKMCLAPCFQGCTDDRYHQEADAVLAFLSTRGRSLLQALEHERDAASEALDFEKAAAIHRRIEKAAAAAGMAGDAVHPLAALNAILVQPAAEAGQAALFQICRGVLSGPVLYSGAGIRLANEQSGSSSLFAQPFAVEAIPLPAANAAQATPQAKDLLERRLDEALEQLHAISRNLRSTALTDHLALFTRWFYRPASRRVGEVVFTDGERLPRKALLRSISRVLAAEAGLGRPKEKQRQEL